MYAGTTIMGIRTIIRRTAALSGLGVGILVGVVCLRTMLIESKQPTFTPPTVPEFADAGGQQAGRLGQAVRFQTVSRDGQPPVSAEFLRMHEFLKTSFCLLYTSRCV